MDFAFNDIRKLADMAPIMQINKSLATLNATLQEKIQENQHLPKPETSASIKKLLAKVDILQKQQERFRLPCDVVIMTAEEFQHKVKAALLAVVQAIISSACGFVLNFKSLPQREQRLWFLDKEEKVLRTAQVQSVKFQPGTESGEMSYVILSQCKQSPTPQTRGWGTLYDPLWDGERTFWNDKVFVNLVWLPRRLELGGCVLSTGETLQVYEALGALEALAYATSPIRLSAEPLCADEDAKEAIVEDGGGVCMESDQEAAASLRNCMVDA